MTSPLDRQPPAPNAQPPQAASPDDALEYSQPGDELSLSGPALTKLLRAVMQKGLPFRFSARGGSMSPFIRDGDIITLAPPGRQTPGIGAIVAFQSNTDRVIVHRIVGRRGHGFITQGDGLPQADGVIEPQQILGRVISVERANRPVGGGLGPQRILIAMLTRSGLWLRVAEPARQRLHDIVRRLR